MMARVSQITLLASLVLFAGCGGDDVVDPKADIERWIGERETDTEEKNRRFLLANIAEAYADGRGNSRDDIDGMLRLWFLRADNITLLTSIDEIEVIDETAAEVLMTVGMAGTDDVGMGFRADAYRFELELVHDGEDWQLIAAQWGELGDPLR
jgi:hypothetical protein